MAKKNGKKGAAGEEFTIEQGLIRLEEIVAQLEHDETPLAEAVNLYEEGSKLARECRERLAEAELRVTRVTESETGEITETEFDEEF